MYSIGKLKKKIIINFSIFLDYYEESYRLYIVEILNINKFIKSDTLMRETRAISQVLRFVVYILNFAI
jgi:hypothetical protein